MNAGQLCHLVTLYRPVPSVNEAGETTVSWEPVRQTWMGIRPLRAFEVERAREVHTDRTHTATARYAADIANDWRIVHGDTVLQIIGIVDVGNRNVEFEIACREVSV